MCTIHQPSSSIFNGFDSLLLLKRGGQTAFFGKLGEECCNLVDFFQSAKNVVPIRLGVNPASWMLETIGAGTNTVTSDDTVDFHVHYKASELCATNTVFAEALCTPNMPTNQYKGHDHDQQMGMGLMAGRDSNAIRITSRLSFATLQSLYHTNTMGLNQEPEVDLSKVQGLSRYNASYLKQLRWLTYRATLSYWRTPNYNLIRFLINIVIALIFASAYANQQVMSLTYSSCITFLLLLPILLLHFWHLFLSFFSFSLNTAITPD